MRILLVEDDAMFGRGLAAALRESAYAVDWVQSGEYALSALAVYDYALLLLDPGLPDLSGLDILARIRSRQRALPTLILTARDGVDERVRGLDIGADDYITKPFALTELKARMRAVLRRPTEAVDPVARHRTVWLDTRTCQADVGDNRPVQLSKREYALFSALMYHPGAILSREQLEERIYGWDDEIESNAVEYLIRAVRKKLGANVIRNVRGLGWLVA